MNVFEAVCELIRGELSDLVSGIVIGAFDPAEGRSRVNVTKMRAGLIEVTPLCGCSLAVVVVGGRVYAGVGLESVVDVTDDLSPLLPTGEKRVVGGSEYDVAICGGLIGRSVSSWYDDFEPTPPAGHVEWTSVVYDGDGLKRDESYVNRVYVTAADAACRVTAQLAGEQASASIGDAVEARRG